MPQPRKSAIQTKAREQARKHGAEIARRHEQLTTLAEEYHAAQIEADMIIRESKKKAGEVINQGKDDAAKFEQQAARKAREMLGTGEPARTVAQRLGVSTATLRRLTTTAEDKTAKASHESKPASPDKFPLTESDNAA